MNKFLIGATLSSFLVINAAHAQVTDTVFRPHGNVWGLSFGDYFYKVNADTVGAGMGRGTNQYSKIPAGSHYFQFRRIYLGYNYDISPRLSAEILLASEDDFNQGSVGNQTNPGDVVNDGKLAPFIKLADVKWKNVFKGSDIVFGQMYTPSFALLSEVVWGYRSVERTVADMRKTNSYDEGVSLQGHYGDGTYGYNVMVGNNNGAKPAINSFQMFYGDVWAKLLDKKLIIDLYQDYAKLDWDLGFHHDRNTTKLMVAYTVPKFTAGIEAMQTTLMSDIAASTLSTTLYYTTLATSVSAYVRGRLYGDKLGFLVRYDNYNPSHKLMEVYNNKDVIQYSAYSTSYDPTTKEQLFIAGIDYTPFQNLHLIPNFYVNTYKCTLPGADFDLNSKSSGSIGTDAVVRVTVYFIFGKQDPIRY